MRLLYCLVVGVLLPTTVHAIEPVADETRLLELARRAGEPYCRQGCFRDDEQAHLAAGAWLLGVALATRRETSWRVYRLDDGSYTFSFPAVGETAATQSRMAPLAAGFADTSAGHIHWDDVQGFSAQDWNWVTGNRKVLYLLTAERVLRKAEPSRARSQGRRGGLGVRGAVGFQGRVVARLAEPFRETRPSIGGHARP